LLPLNYVSHSRGLCRKLKYVKINSLNNLTTGGMSGWLDGASAVLLLLHDAAVRFEEESFFQQMHPRNTRDV